MKIGIFGGSFNPPHKMHKNIAKYLIDNNYVDKIIFVPTGDEYKYKNNLIKDKDRYEMLKIMTKQEDNMLVSDYELKDYVVYTFQTLDYFKKVYPNDEIFFICGTDNLSYIDKWMNGKYILENYKILVINRGTNKIDDIMPLLSEYKKNIIVTNMEMDTISSTFIRNNINTGGNKYLDIGVWKYIQKNNLY